MPESTLPAPTACQGCGRPIDEDAPGNVCPACLATALLTEGGTRSERHPVTTTLLAGFQLGRKLGEGGFGAVYAAEQLHPVRRPVAVKILKGGDHNEQALARFEAERQALALLDHPNIARVYHAGETADSEPFFVMELIEGLPLTSHCRERDLALAERLALFREVCEAVTHAHRRGIIHRDLKPSNLLVAEHDGKPNCKIIDFGIAKATDDLLTQRTLVTQNNQLLGTPAYMSPEQAAGTNVGIDTRSDLYSLGVLLYELVTGSAPFPAAELSALPYDEALRRIRTEDPPRPSSRLREQGLPLPPSATDLDAIVMKSIEKDPERRYETAGALSRDVERYLHGEAVLARPASAAYRARKLMRKHRGLVMATSLVILSLVAGTVVSLFMFVRARDSAREAAASEARGKERFSHADFTQATPFLDNDQPALAVAHLARAVRTDPANQAAAIRLLETLATQNWAVPACPPLSIGGMVRGTVYSPDGSRLFTSSEAGNLSIWAPSTGELLHRIELEDVPDPLIVSRDGRRFASLLARSGKIQVWNSADHSLIATISAPRSRGGHLEFSPDGTLLLSSHDNGHAHLWNLDTRSLHKCIPQEGDFVRARFSPDGKTIATYNSRHFRLWSLDGEARHDAPLATEGSPRGLLFTSDGSRLLTWTSDQVARLWNPVTGEPAGPTFHHASTVNHASISPDDSRLVTAASDGFVRLWDLRTGALLGAPRRHEGAQSVAFSPDGTRFASGSIANRLGHGDVKIWSADDAHLLVAPIYHHRGANEAIFHPEGTEVAVRSRHNEVTIWDIRPRTMSPLRLQHGKPVWRTRFDRNDRELVTLALDGEARAWDASTGALLTTEPVTAGPVAIRAHAGAQNDLRSGFRQGRFYGQPHWTLPSFERMVAPSYREGGVGAAAASLDGRLLVTGCRDGSIRLWSLESGQPARGPIEHGPPVTAVALDANGTRLASGAEDGTVRIWALATGDLLASFTGHRKAVIALSFSPDGGTLASGSADQTARLWLGTSPAPLLQHQGDVSQLTFSPDGELLATGSRDNAVRIWNVEDGSLLAGPLRHIDSASMPGLFPLWSPDGTRLVSTGSHDDTARVWDPRTGRTLAKTMMLPSCPLSATLDPSGRVLLLGSDFDFQTRLWHPVSGEPLGPLLHNGGRVLSVAFSPTGHRYAAGTHPGAVVLRDAPIFRDRLTVADLAFAEALGGFRFNEDGILEEVPPGAWQEARRTIMEDERTGPLATWLKWLAADPVNRPPSPFLGTPSR